MLDYTKLFVVLCRRVIDASRAGFDEFFHDVCVATECCGSDGVRPDIVTGCALADDAGLGEVRARTEHKIHGGGVFADDCLNHESRLQLERVREISFSRLLRDVKLFVEHELHDLGATEFAGDEEDIVVAVVEFRLHKVLLHVFFAALDDEIFKILV